MASKWEWMELGSGYIRNFQGTRPKSLARWRTKYWAKRTTDHPFVRFYSSRYRFWADYHKVADLVGVQHVYRDHVLHYGPKLYDVNVDIVDLETNISTRIVVNTAFLKTAMVEG